MSENLRHIFTDLTGEFASAGIESPRRDAALLLAECLGIGLATVYARPDLELAAEQTDQIRRLGRQRSERVPLAYLLGHADFFGRTFRVGQGVLIPRPDSECLVETALRVLDPLSSPVNMMDLCTGSGCIGISLACEMREQGRPCNLVMTESDPAAAAYARENLERFALNSTTQLMIADLFPPLPDNPADFAHLIVANPPYIPANQIDNLMPEVSIHEPRSALDGGADGLDFYRRIIVEAPQFLKVGGWLLLEHGFDQAEQVDTLLRSAGCFENMETEMDYGGNPRVSGGRFRPDLR